MTAATMTRPRFTLGQWADAGYGWYLGLDTLPEPKAGTAAHKAWTEGRARAVAEERAKQERVAE